MSGRPVLAAVVSGPSAVRKLLNCGANGLAACEQLRELALGGAEFVEERVGDRRRSVSSSCSATVELALERRQRAEGLGERLARFGGRVEGALAVDDQPFELVVAAGERVEDDAGVVHERPHRAFLGGEHADQLVGVFDERFERRRSEALICSPRPLIAAGRYCCHTWKLRRVLGSSTERMSSSVTDGSTWLSASCAPSARYGPACCSGGSAARRSPRAASSGAGSRACSRGSARTGCAISIVASVRPSLPSFSETTWPTLTPLIRTSDCSASASVRGKVDREAIALRLQRHGPAEGLPQEQQQPEAAQREQDDHEDVAERGRALLHLSGLPRRRRTARPRATRGDWPNTRVPSAENRPPAGRLRHASARALAALRMPGAAGTPPRWAGSAGRPAG